VRPRSGGIMAAAPARARLPHNIAPFRHDNPDAIVAASAAFVQFCRERELIGGRMVALDGTKMRAVASPKNFAGAEQSWLGKFGQV
jgi:hypothetical protein